jgi:drug/metabolite transporter (DMT)-like permease
MWKEPWALGAMLAWGGSCLLWGLLLTRYGVGQATGTSALRYGLILVAAALWLGETMNWRQGLGCGLIGVGIWLTAK